MKGDLRIAKLFNITVTIKFLQTRYSEISTFPWPVKPLFQNSRTEKTWHVTKLWFFLLQYSFSLYQVESFYVQQWLRYKFTGTHVDIFDAVDLKKKKSPFNFFC